MKSINTFFNEFLRDEVNLNPTRLTIAKKGIEVITTFLKNNDLFKNNFIKISPQGSYRQGTIIKPVDDREFDVDILLLLHEFDDWQPRDYINNLHREFKNTSRYENIVDRKGKSRCITIDYANDFHIDIVPAIKRNGQYQIMNKNSNEFEDTDGDGYAQWFEEKNQITSKKYLTKAIRLTKYLRDIKTTFSIKSVLLTTLLGKQVHETDKLDQDILYKNLPTALKTLFNRLNNYLKFRPNLTDEIITNPVLPSEKFNRHWDEDRYTNFRDKVDKYNQWINEAYEEQDINESVNKWRKIFGDDFGEIQEQMSMVSLYASQSIKHQEEFIDKIYTLDLYKGWKLSIAVKSSQPRNGFRQLHFRKGVNLTFFVDKAKSYLPPDTIIKWKVKNSGQEAKLKNQLRGNIEDDQGYRCKEETTLYQGRHYVDCYALKDNIVIAMDTIYITVI
ncbi:SMODS domain-containing nucleotidyltransferase [Cyanobacterium aponinum]|uniref:SMODS domain-containing nucleotidyltransferase n=1 Tax=Cyanobacterium aponinum TaxID=379064 RepID=UPI000C12B5C6|nr:nucleotidyltransferase [Cyanobacterium aponinum]PHV61934.1 nucleotidyltransferase [Cyanobacterium aponinum IPPAS B-1201]